MRKVGLLLMTSILLTPISVVAKEGFMCSHYYPNVARAMANIKGHGDNLSAMAKTKLFSDLENDTKLCLSECEGEKFSYCNEIAKWISK